MGAYKAGSKPIIQQRHIPPSLDREVRFLTECRALADPGQPLQIAGHAAIFNSLTKLTKFRERVLSGAFKRAINEKQNVACLFNHDTNKILGRIASGTLRLAEDGIGLKYVCDLPDTSEARGFHEAIRRGDISGSSYGFALTDDDQDWDEAQDEEDRSYFVRRTIKNVTHLLDVSPVLFPAFPGTDVQARSTVEAPAELRSAVAAKNARHNYKASRNLIFVPDMPTPDVCRAITERAQKRHADERAIVKRRKALVNDILNS